MREARIIDSPCRFRERRQGRIEAAVSAAVTITVEDCCNRG
jgi:hypothetical protein